MIEKTLRDFVVDAIWSIHPSASFTTGDTYESLKWNSKDLTKPTEDEWDTALANVQTEWIAQAYTRNRATAFLSIGEQLDMLFHDMTAGKGTKDGEWYKAVAKVKADNPKPDGWKE